MKMILPPIDIPALDDVVQQVIWDLGRRVNLSGIFFTPLLQVRRVQRSIMAAQFFENIFGPAPVLKQCTGHFPDVDGQSGAMEACILRVRDEIMHSMTKLFCCKYISTPCNL